MELFDDEPHTIKDCSGRGFTIFDYSGCRITVDGIGCVDVADNIILAIKKMEKED